MIKYVPEYHCYPHWSLNRQVSVGVLTDFLYSIMLMNKMVDHCVECGDKVEEAGTRLLAKYCSNCVSHKRDCK